MDRMRLVTDTIPVSTRGNTDIIDITSHVASLLRKHQLSEGQALVFVTGSTAGITTIEYEPGLLKDLPEVFEKLAPQNARYHHEDTWHDGNGHSHVRAALLGCSLTVPFKDGRLLLGTWQQLVLIDFDNRSRHREIVVQFHGQ
jgi:secondary thiamine-phosphate synthase enzyme